MGLKRSDSNSIYHSRHESGSGETSRRSLTHSLSCTSAASFCADENTLATTETGRDGVLVFSTKSSSVKVLTTLKKKKKKQPKGDQQQPKNVKPNESGERTKSKKPVSTAEVSGRRIKKANSLRKLKSRTVDVDLTKETKETEKSAPATPPAKRRMSPSSAHETKKAARSTSPSTVNRRKSPSSAPVTASSDERVPGPERRQRMRTCAIDLQSYLAGRVKSSQASVMTENSINKHSSRRTASRHPKRPDPKKKLVPRRSRSLTDMRNMLRPKSDPLHKPRSNSVQPRCHAVEFGGIVPITSYHKDSATNTPSLHGKRPLQRRLAKHERYSSRTLLTDANKEAVSKTVNTPASSPTKSAIITSPPKSPRKMNRRSSMEKALSARHIAKKLSVSLRQLSKTNSDRNLHQHSRVRADDSIFGFDQETYLKEQGDLYQKRRDLGFKDLNLLKHMEECKRQRERLQPVGDPEELRKVKMANYLEEAVHSKSRGSNSHGLSAAEVQTKLSSLKRVTTKQVYGNNRQEGWESYFSSSMVS